MRSDQELIQTLRQLALQNTNNTAQGREYSAFLREAAYRLEQLSEQAGEQQRIHRPSKPV